jgi:hypothetical protein
LLPLGRASLDAVHRVRLARGVERWMLTFEPGPDGDGALVRLLRQADGDPVTSVPTDDGLGCLAALPPTEYPPRACELAWDDPEDAGETPLLGALHGLAVADGGAFAFVFEPADAPGAVALASVQRGARRGPVMVAEAGVAPAIAEGAAGGWLVSWTDPESGAALVRHFDARLRPTGRALELAADLWTPRLAWAETRVRRREERAALLVVRDPEAPESLAVRLSGVKVDGTRERRSGDMPLGAAPTAPPALAGDDAEGLLVAWSDASGVFVRPVGTDGLPAGPAMRVTAEPATAVSAAYAEESWWLVASDDAGTRWWRLDRAGCLDDAGGVLPGRPTSATQSLFADETGVYAVMQDCGGTAIFRLEDDGAGGTAAELGRIDPSRFPSAWVPDPDGARGVVDGAGPAGPGALTPARWLCR